MLANMKIKTKLLLLILTSVLLMAIITSIVSIISIKTMSKENIENFKKDSYVKKEKELKNYVSLAIKNVENYYARTSLEMVKIEVEEDLETQTNFLFTILTKQYEKYKDEISAFELKRKLIDIVEASRYGKNGYFWINDTKAVIVMHPTKPSLNSKNLDNFKDKNGKRIFHEFAKIASKSGSGFVDYVWPKPGFNKAQSKVSYVKLFKPYNWVIGTGSYVDDISSKMKKEALKSVSEERFGENGYFWITDSSAKMLMHPIKPSLDNKDVSTVKDKKGKLLFVEMAKIANKEKKGGLVRYFWPKPGFDLAQEKFSYIQRFDKWDFVIGTGAYINDINDEILLMEEKTNNSINDVISDILIYTLISLILITAIVNYISSKILIKPLESLNSSVQFLLSGRERRNKLRVYPDNEIGKVMNSLNLYFKHLRDEAAKDAEVIREVEDVITKVNNGFYVYKIHSNSNNNSIQQLKDSINSMIASTNKKLENINLTLSEYSKSNFTYKCSDNEGYTPSNGLIASLENSTDLIGNAVSEFLAMITISGEKLNSDTKVLKISSTNLSTSANTQASSLEETAASVEEITSIIKSSNEKVNKMSILAADLNKSALEGEKLALKTTSSMEAIDAEVNSINDAITVIDQIAFQTNILSLNAAVEAATAGEAGKGFAVVAQEVRNLASRSAEAAKEIKDLVSSATLKANEGKEISKDMIEGYTSLNAKISETIDLITDVTSATKEQEHGIVQINDAINSLDQATQVNASSASSINELAHEVSVLSDDLLSIASRAKYNENKKDEVCDVEFVFLINKLKNDHITFKDVNFAKVGEGNVSSWTVKTCLECNLGKWIKEQENKSSSFVNNNNWTNLKKHHEEVHQSVQEYINLNAQKASNMQLAAVSKNVDVSSHNVFKNLDILKEHYCKTFKTSNKTLDLISAKIENVSQKKTFVSKKVVNNLIPDKTDEWESF